VATEKTNEKQASRDIYRDQFNDRLVESGDNPFTSTADQGQDTSDNNIQSKVSAKDSATVKRQLNIAQTNSRNKDENQEENEVENKPESGRDLEKGNKAIAGKTAKEQSALKRKLNFLKSKKQKIAAKKQMAQKAASNMFNPIFLATLFLAGLKDLIDSIVDLVDAGLTGSLINIIVTLAFTIVLLLQGKTKRKLKMKRYAVGAIAEFIPIINWLPFWTGTVLYDKFAKPPKKK